MSIRNLFESVLQNDQDILRTLLSARMNPDSLLNASECSEEDDAALVRALDNEFTPLFIAAALNNVAACRILIAAGADPDAAGKDGHTVLMEAVEKKSLDCMRLLLTEMHAPSAVNKEGETALFHAVATGSAEAVQMLLDAGLDIEHCDQYGRTVLFKSIRHLENPCFDFLLSRNANPLHRAKGDVTTLMAACTDYSESASLVQKLLDCGVDVNAVTNAGKSALCIAARSGSIAKVKALVAAGATVNPPDDNLTAPLAMAAAEFNSVNPEGRNLRHYLWNFCLTRSYSIPEVMQFLLDCGADPNPVTEEGVTALMHAAGKDAVQSIDVLVKNGASIDAVDHRGWTALHYAAVENRLHAIRKLAALGIPVDQADFDGDTALMCAAFHGKWKAVGLLLRLGADPARKDVLGLTAMDAAKSNGHEDLAAGLYRRVERRSR